MRKLILASILPLALVPVSAALAGGTAVINAGGDTPQTIDLSWRGDLIRINPRGESAYIVVRDGKPYSVSEIQGQTMVMDLSSMAEMAQDSGMTEDMAGDMATEVTSIEKTGATETVAGIAGEVHRIVWKDGNGEQHTDEVVLTDDATVVSMTQAFRSFVEANNIRGKTGDPDAIGEALADRELGILKFGNEYRIGEVSDDTPSADQFELPAEPMNMQEMMQNMMKQGQ